ncbi:MAG TPA: hypothetical protein VH478_03265 [Trebonia sp.]|nr:hypothetical protein [Trebonia sp.]
MRIPAWLAPAIIILTAAPLAACSSGPGPATPAAAGPASSASAAAGSSPAPPPASSGTASGQGAGAEIDACTLLATARASALAGKDYASAAAATIAPGQDQCTYHAADDSSDLVIIVYQPASGVGWPMMTSVLSGAGAVKPVSGLGDKAMVGQIELDVQAGQRLVAIQGAGGLLEGDYSKAVAIARIVIASLP